MVRSALVALIASIAAACGDAYERPAIPDAGPAPGPECSAAVACPGGGVCLGGRCYPACTPTSCAAGEICMAGACVPVGVVPPPPPPPPVDGGPDAADDASSDAGPSDAGDAGPGLCATVRCAAPLVCDPSDGTCVQCTDRECDAMPSGTCDVAGAVCGTFAPGPCSPCDDAADCLPGAQCVISASPRERVCLPSCAAAACPQGMQCDARMLCVPILGTCTERYRATQELMCTADSECTPRGSTTMNRCELGICRAPCEPARSGADCPMMGAMCLGGVCAGGM